MQCIFPPFTVNNKILLCKAYAVFKLMEIIHVVFYSVDDNSASLPTTETFVFNVCCQVKIPNLSAIVAWCSVVYCVDRYGATDYSKLNQATE